MRTAIFLLALCLLQCLLAQDNAEAAAEEKVAVEEEQGEVFEDAPPQGEAAENQPPDMGTYVSELRAATEKAKDGDEESLYRVRGGLQFIAQTLNSNPGSRDALLAAEDPLGMFFSLTTLNDVNIAQLSMLCLYQLVESHGKAFAEFGSMPHLLNMVESQDEALRILAVTMVAYLMEHDSERAEVVARPVLAKAVRKLLQEPDGQVSVHGLNIPKAPVAIWALNAMLRHDDSAGSLQYTGLAPDLHRKLGAIATRFKDQQTASTIQEVMVKLEAMKSAWTWSEIFAIFAFAAGTVALVVWKVQERSAQALAKEQRKKRNLPKAR